MRLLPKARIEVGYAKLGFGPIGVFENPQMISGFQFSDCKIINVSKKVQIFFKKKLDKFLFKRLKFMQTF